MRAPRPDRAHWQQRCERGRRKGGKVAQLRSVQARDVCAAIAYHDATVHLDKRHESTACEQVPATRAPHEPHVLHASVLTSQPSFYGGSS